MYRINEILVFDYKYNIPYFRLKIILNVILRDTDAIENPRNLKIQDILEQYFVPLIY